MFDLYRDQVEFLLEVLPLIQKEERFALKGGTAINLFHRDMPRLSVDIDLTYLPIEPRKLFLENLDACMRLLANELTGLGFFVNIREVLGVATKLIVSNAKTTIKIEPNTTLRGCVFEPEICELVGSAQNEFFQSQKVKTVSMPDLYAGKICAALDRQHPRDWFDIKMLLDEEGLSAQTRQAFVVYLASSPRPMSELLSPNRIDLENTYKKEFVGMTRHHIELENLYGVREKLIKQIHSDLTVNEKSFLMSIKLGKPDWSLLPFSHIESLPGVQWKLFNIQKMKSDLRAKALHKLESVLSA